MAARDTHQLLLAPRHLCSLHLQLLQLQLVRFQLLFESGNLCIAEKLYLSKYLGDRQKMGRWAAK